MFMDKLHVCLENAILDRYSILYSLYSKDVQTVQVT